MNPLVFKRGVFDLFAISCSPYDGRMAPRYDITTPMTARRIIMAGFDKAQILDIVGPMQILSAINDLRRLRYNLGPAYELTLAATTSGQMATTSGLKLAIDRPFSAFTDEDFDNLDAVMVSGGEGTLTAMQDKTLLDFMRAAAPHARRLISICSGTFVLAEAGLIKNKRVTTHWDNCAGLARRYPDLTVEPDALFVRDGHIWSSAGVTAGMDLALALIEEDWGHDVAIELARRHVLFMIRPGGQSQFSTHLQAQALESGRLGDLPTWIAENPSEDLSIPALANRACLTPRTFARVFRKETGTTPADFVEQARTDAARRALEDTGQSVDQIAHVCGFGNAERMRRTFHRRLGVGPQAYRARFSRLSLNRPQDQPQEQHHEYRHFDL